MRRGLFVVGLVIVVLLLAWIAYRVVNREAVTARGPLPPRTGPITFAGATPEHPFHLEPGNILSRTAFQTSASPNFQVEVRDVVFPPHAKTQLPALHGPALFEVYSGEGTVLTGERSERLSSGSMRSAAAGQEFTIDNPGAYPMVLRLYGFEAK